jgi:hypothetical protein
LQPWLRKDALQNQGTGAAQTYAGLVGEAVRRTMQAAEIAGIRALAVHAKVEQARRYHEQFDFVASRRTRCTC